MKTLSHVSDSALAESLKTLVREERRITLEILNHLREVERRRLFAERGYPSLFDYCMKELGYSESAAFRRISTMRALKETPDLEAAIQDGRLSITAIARVQTFLKSEKRDGGKDYSPEEKKSLFTGIENMSSREVERTLVAISPDSARPKEQQRALSSELTEIRFVADEELLQKLRKLRDLTSHRLKDPTSYAELFGILATEMLKKLDPTGLEPTDDHVRLEKTVAAPEVEASKVVIRKGRETSAGQQLTIKTHSRYIPQSIRREVWRKAHGRCTFKDRRSGKSCGSTFKLQIDHIRPFAWGGSSRDPANLTLLCATHNQLRATQAFGERGRRT